MAAVLFIWKPLFSATAEWPPFTCQRDLCPNAGNAEAAKVCYDHDISIIYANERPPPLYLCIECANDIHSKHEDKMFFDILHPMQQVAVACESKVSHNQSFVQNFLFQCI